MFSLKFMVIFALNLLKITFLVPDFSVTVRHGFRHGRVTEEIGN